MAPKVPRDGSIPGNATRDNLDWKCGPCNGDKTNWSPEQYYGNGGLVPQDATKMQNDPAKKSEAIQAGERTMIKEAIKNGLFN